MDFSIALAHVKEGRSVKKKGWQGRIALGPDRKIYYVWPSGGTMVYGASQADLLAEDWELCEDA